MLIPINKHMSLVEAPNQAKFPTVIVYSLKMTINVLIGHRLWLR